MVAIRQALRRSAKVRYGLLGAAAVLGAAQFAPAGTFNWTQTDAGAGSPYSWTDSTNWDSIPSNTNGDIVNVNANIVGNTTIDLNSDVILGILNIGDTDTTNIYTIAAGTNPSTSNPGTLTFNNGGAGAQLNESSTSFGDTISAAISVTDAGGLAINNYSATKTLILNGGVTTNSNNMTIASGNVSFGAVSIGTGSIASNSLNTVTFSGALTDSGTSAGTITVNSGTMLFTGTSNSLSDSINVYGGTLTNQGISTATATDPYGTGTIYLGTASSSTANATIVNYSQADVINNPIDVQAGTTGTLTIQYSAGANGGANFTGNITMDNNLTIQNNDGGNGLTIGTLGTSTITEGSAALTLTVKSTNNTASTTIADAVSLGAGGLTITNQTTKQVAFTGEISGSSTITINNTNTVSFSYASNAMTSEIDVDSGTLTSLSSLVANSTPFGSGTIFLGNPSGGSTNATILNPDVNDSITNPITVSAGNTGTTLQNTGGSGQAFKTGLITLGGNLTYINNSNGGNAEDIGNPITVTGSAVTLTVQGTNTGGTVFQTGLVTLTSGLTIINTQSHPSNVTLSGNVTGAGALTYQCATTGVLILSGSTNNFSGGLTLNGGTVEANNANSGVLGSGNVTFDTTAAETLNLNKETPTVGLLNGTNADGVITNNTVGTATLTLKGSGTQIFSGTIQNGSSTKIVALTMEAGTQTLNGTNTYTGTTTVNGGRLIAGSASALGAGTVTVSGGTLELDPAVTGVINFNLTTGTAQFDLATDPTAELTGTGIFTLADGTDVNLGGVSTPGTYTLLDFAGTGSTIGNITIDGYAGNLTASALTLGTDGSNTTAFVTLTSSSVPEPASLALLGIGGLMLLRRRRRVSE